MIPQRTKNKPERLHRLYHPDFLIFVLGGFLGASVNLGITFFLFSGLNLNPLIAFFFGTLGNQFFHHFWYRVVYANKEIRFKTPLPLHFFLYLCVALISSVFFGILLTGAAFSFWAAFFSSLFLLSLSNVVLIRISTFSSSHLASVEYRGMNESYYDDQTDVKKVSRFRAWYHRSRYEKMTKFVSEYFRPGMKMADLGCANCWWNVLGLPVFGVDINEKMLKWAKRNKRLKDFRVTADLSKTGLKPKSFDLVLMSETLEHLLDLKGVLREVDRVLKPNGKFLITVPYDYFLGPFFILFNLNCIYMGYVKGSLYHKYRCGHINHFTKGRLRKVLGDNGFELKRCFVVNGLLLYAVAVKKGPLNRGLENVGT